MDIKQMLLSRSGLTEQLINAGKPDEAFSRICSALEDIHKGKEVLYGEYLITHGSDPTLFALIEHFCDIKRKYVRAEHFVKGVSAGVQFDLHELLDTYCDTAVYAIMGIQLVLHLKQRDEANVHTIENERSDAGKPRGEWSDNCDADFAR